MLHTAFDRWERFTLTAIPLPILSFPAIQHGSFDRWEPFRSPCVPLSPSIEPRCLHLSVYLLTDGNVSALIGITPNLIPLLL